VALQVERRAGGTASGRGWDCLLVSSPDQKASVFISREPLGADEFFLKVFDIFVIQGKPPL
jgi:hypothetical protein